MYTDIADWSHLQEREFIIQTAVSCLKEGSPIVIPTETVYGLAAGIESQIGIQRIYNIKSRPLDNPLIVHVSSENMLLNLIDINKQQKYWIDQLLKYQLLPGPLTLVLQKNKARINYASTHLETIAARWPKNDCFQSILDVYGSPIAAPSANISGRPSGTNIQDIYQELKGSISLFIEDPKPLIGIESTVLDLTQSIPSILRLGKVGQTQLSNVLGCPVQFEKFNNVHTVKSPGLKYKHYKPHAQIILYKTKQQLDHYIELYDMNRNESVSIISQENASMISLKSIIYIDIQQLAENLYKWFYQLEKEYQNIFIHIQECEDEFYQAIYERIYRSADKILF